MKKIRNKVLYWLAIAGASCTHAFSQQVTARLEASQNGWQVIRVPQEFRAKIGQNTGMLRIKDQKGNDVPYILKHEATEKTDFIPVQYSRRHNHADSSEHLIIDNPSRQERQNYILKIANTSVVKPYSVEGSDDQDIWFGLVSRGYLDQLSDINQTYVTKSVSFPRTAYRFIRLSLDNRSSAPINILDVGEWRTDVLPISYEKLRNVVLTQENKKKAKTTLLSITKDLASPVDFIRIHVSAPSVYHREAELYSHESSSQPRGAGLPYAREYLTLSTANKEGFTVGPITDATFYIRIFNGDDAPLRIDSVSLYQKPMQLIAGLKRGFTYSLEADSGWNTPNYDLAKTELALPDTLPQAHIKAIEFLEKDQKGKINKYGNLILIVCSAIGVAILFYFGSSLLKDMKGRGD